MASEKHEDEEARMSDIAEYERRIAFALERIGRGVEALKQREALQAQATQEATHQPEPETAPPAEAELPHVPEAPPEVVADPAEVAELKAALAAEQEANAQLSERVRAIREKQDTTLNAMERKYGAAVRAQEAAFKEVAALKAANTALIASNRKLMDEGVAFSEEALMAELTALRAARASEFNELGDILDGLAPILAQAEEESQDA
jgi:type IV secretory pathway VirB10-like protein